MQALKKIQAEQFYDYTLDKVEGIKVEITELGEHLSATIVKDNVLEVVLLLLIL